MKILNKKEKAQIIEELENYGIEKPNYLYLETGREFKSRDNRIIFIQERKRRFKIKLRCLPFIKTKKQNTRNK